MFFNLFKACSALRIIPDALPAQANTEALMASLNEIFNVSNWTPESLAPSDDAVDSEDGDSTYVDAGIGIIPVSFSVETDNKTTMDVLYNLERSIRIFDIKTATVEWAGTNHLELNATAWAYYTNTSSLKEATVTVAADKSQTKTLEDIEEETKYDEE